MASSGSLGSDFTIPGDNRVWKSVSTRGSREGIWERVARLKRGHTFIRSLAWDFGGWDYF